MNRDEAIAIFLHLKDRNMKCLELIGRYPHPSRLILTTQAIDMAIEALQREEAEEKGYCHRIKLKQDQISRSRLFNKLATVQAPPEANEYKAEVYKIIQSMGTEEDDEQ